MQTVDNKYLLALAQEVESRFDISQLHSCGFNVWPLLRISLCFDFIQRSSSPIVRGERKESKRLSFSKALSTYFRVIGGSGIKINDAIFLTSDAYLVNVNGKLFDRVHHDNFNKSELNPRTYFNVSDGSIRRSDSHEAIDDLSDVLRLIKFLSLLYTVVVVVKNWAVFAKLFKVCSYYKRQNIMIVGTLLRFPARVAYVSLLSKFLIRYIKATAITSVEQSCFYSTVGMAFTLAGRRCKLPTTNIQHGVQSDFHPAFGKWHNIPESGYSLLPATFFCWDEQSATVLLKSFDGRSDYKVVEVGYAWARAWSAGDIPYDDNKIKVQARRSRNVLVTMQPSIPGLQGILEQLLRETDLDVTWWLRLHPRQDYDGSREQLLSQFYSTGTDADCIVNLATDSPLPALLPNMDLHITGFSSSIYEAAMFGIETILIHPTGLAYYGDELPILNAHYCDSCAGLQTVLRRLLITKSPLSSIASS